MGQPIQYVQVRLKTEDSDRDGTGAGGGIDWSARDGDHLHLVRDGEQQRGHSCGTESQSRETTHYHFGSGAFVSVELLHGPRKGRISGYLSAC